MCYELRNECCDLCREVADLYHNLTDCVYGDRREWCNDQPTNSCYDIQEDCCFTCQRQQTGIKAIGCQYGDREDICKDMEAHHCYSGGNQTCCSTCQKFETGRTDCQYGDRVTTCIRESCNAYDENSRRLCCGTCAAPTTITVTASLSSSSTSALISLDRSTTYNINSGILSTYKTELSPRASTDKELVVTLPSVNTSTVSATAAATLEHNRLNDTDITAAANKSTTFTTSTLTTGTRSVSTHTTGSTMSQPAITGAYRFSSPVKTTHLDSSVTTRLKTLEKTPITRNVSSTQIPHVVNPSTASTGVAPTNAEQTFRATKRLNATSKMSTNTTRCPPKITVSFRSSSVSRSTMHNLYNISGSSSKAVSTVRLPISSTTAKPITSAPFITAEISSTVSFTAVRSASTMRTKLMIPNATALKTISTKSTMGVGSLLPLRLLSTSAGAVHRQTSPSRTMPMRSNATFTGPKTSNTKATEESTSPVSLRGETTRSNTEVTKDKATSTRKAIPTSYVLTTTLDSTRISFSMPTTLSTELLCLVVFYWIFTEL